MLINVNLFKKAGQSKEIVFNLDKQGEGTPP